MSKKYGSTGDTSTRFVKRLKDLFKIKRKKNKDYSAKTGTKTPDKRFASFREDSSKNKKLQKEAKDPTKNIRTFDRVTKENKDKYSDQHKVKSKDTPKTKTKRVKGRKLSPYQMRLEERKEAMRAKARKRHAEFKAARAAKRKK